MINKYKSTLLLLSFLIAIVSGAVIADAETPVATDGRTSTHSPDTTTESTVADSTLSDTARPLHSYLQHGKATHYSKRWHGRRTSSGERLDMQGYQCAHKTLPFGTLVRVTNEKNGKSCVVKVIDRGPFGKRYVIDLTIAAAHKIGMMGHGVVPVKLEVVEAPSGAVIADGEVALPTDSTTVSE